jgi:hypothetical protein
MPSCCSVVQACVRASFGVRAFNLALREVTAHVPAVAVEHIVVAVRAAEDDKLLAEGVDRVRLAVTEISDQTQAVPAAGEPLRRGLRFNEPNFVDLRLRHHGNDLTPAVGSVGLSVPLIRTTLLLPRRTGIRFWT